MNTHSALTAEDMDHPLFQVLYVEDQPAVAAVILLELQRVGVDITTAHNAERALELARQKPFDLILMDVLLRDTSGFDLCRRLKDDDRLKEVPVIFFTGVPTAQGRNEALALGSMGYLNKGTDRAQLGRQILNAVKLARATASSRMPQGPALPSLPVEFRNQPVLMAAFDSDGTTFFTRSSSSSAHSCPQPESLFPKLVLASSAGPATGKS